MSATTMAGVCLGRKLASPRQPRAERRSPHSAATASEDRLVAGWPGAKSQQAASLTRSASLGAIAFLIALPGVAPSQWRPGSRQRADPADERNATNALVDAAAVGDRIRPREDRKS